MTTWIVITYQLTIEIIWDKHTFHIQAYIFSFWIYYIFIVKGPHSRNVKNTPELHLTLHSYKSKVKQPTSCIIYSSVTVIIISTSVVKWIYASGSKKSLKVFL